MKSAQEGIGIPFIYPCYVFTENFLSVHLHGIVHNITLMDLQNSLYYALYLLNYYPRKWCVIGWYAKQALSC